MIEIFFCDITNLMGYHDLSKNFSRGPSCCVEELYGLAIRIELIALGNVTRNGNSGSANLISKPIVPGKGALPRKLVKKHGEFFCALPYFEFMEISDNL